MKKPYEEVELELIRFSCEDIITASTGAGEGGASGDGNDLDDDEP